MNPFVWVALYLLVGSFGWGVKTRSSNAITTDEYPILLFLALLWPLGLLLWLLVLPYRAGRWVGRRWPDGKGEA